VLSRDARVILGFYEDLFDRVPTDGEVLFWINQLRTTSYTQVATAFVTSPERRAKIINDLYVEYLGRSVDQAGLSYWLNLFNKTGGAEIVQMGIIGSAEYYAKAGATP